MPKVRTTKTRVQIWMSVMVHLLLVLVDAELGVELVHAPHVDGDDQHEDDDRTLLCEPEPEREAQDRELVEGFDEDDPGPEGDERPNRKQDRHEAEVSAPVAPALCLVHSH